MSHGFPNYTARGPRIFLEASITVAQEKLGGDQPKSIPIIVEMPRVGCLFKIWL